MEKKDKMALDSRGLKLVLAGVLVMIAGYILMIGGGSDDPQVFNEAMFDFRRLVAAPVVILAGIAVVVIALVGARSGKKEQ